MSQDSQGLSENDLPLLGFDCRLKLGKLHSLSVPTSNTENILSPVTCLFKSQACRRGEKTPHIEVGETKKSALGQMHLGEEGCWKSQRHSVTWKAHKERVKPAALLWHMCTPLFFFRGYLGKLIAFPLQPNMAMNLGLFHTARAQCKSKLDAHL